MINLILSGGSGTRMWPVSRRFLPKQFFPLIENESLFTKTIQRNISTCEKFICVTNKDQYFLAKAQAEKAQAKFEFILEPIGRNTAPAIALACLTLDPEVVVLVLPSDHLIANQDAYLDALNQAEAFAKEGFLVTFGIEPDYPETGYGYIEARGNDVKSFREKPDFETATDYLASGNYFWNSGMFCFKAGVFLSELEKYSPNVLSASKTALEETPKEEALAIPMEAMMEIPDISIDYGVMEHSTLVKVVPVNMGWSDLGSFDALGKHLPADDFNNTEVENLATVNSKNNILISSNRTIALVDIDDLIVVDTADALLICKQGSSQKVKQVVDQLKISDEEITLKPRELATDFGSKELVFESKEASIFVLKVNPGKRIIPNPKAQLLLLYGEATQDGNVIGTGTLITTPEPVVNHNNFDIHFNLTIEN